MSMDSSNLRPSQRDDPEEEEQDDEDLFWEDLLYDPYAGCDLYDPGCEFD